MKALDENVKDFKEALKTPLPEGVRRLSRLCAWAVIALWPVLLLFGVRRVIHDYPSLRVGGGTSDGSTTVFLGIRIDIPPEAFCILSCIIILVAALVLAPKIAQIILWVKDGYNLPDSK